MDLTDIIAYLNGHSTEEESRSIEQWIAESDANKVFFEETKVIWQHSQALEAKPPNVELAWKQVQDHAQQKKRSLVFYLSRVAAALLLLISVYTIWDYVQRPTWSSYEQASIENLEAVTLSDGTKVWLNQDAILSYPKQFTGKKRSVKLEGEAFFEVVRNEGKPFFIETAQVGVQVLGTSFNLMSHPDSSTSYIQVKSGKVAFYENGKEAKGIVLEKDQVGQFNSIDQSLTKTTLTDANYLAWKTKTLEFNNTSLKEVVQQVKRVYGKELHFDNPQLANCKLTASFKQEPVEHIYETLEILFDIETRKENNKITLYGTGCNTQ